MTPLLRVPGVLADAIAPEALAQLSSAELLGFLAGRRWFGAKAAARSARIVDAVRLPWDDPPSAVARVEVALDGGATQCYQLPLVVRPQQPDGAPLLARVEAPDARGVLVDAVSDAGFRQQLGAHAVRVAVDGIDAQPHGRCSSGVQGPRTVAAHGLPAPCAATSSAKPWRAKAAL